PELNHIVYVVGEGGGKDGEAAFGTSAAAEMTSFLAFAEALARAGTSSYRPLPEAVVVTRGVHPCLDGDEVEGWPMSWLPGILRSLALQYPQLKMR
ncbi:unnamed protein product, partial [Ectocarpus sp. 12 AP-2014]